MTSDKPHERQLHCLETATANVAMPNIADRSLIRGHPQMLGRLDDAACGHSVTIHARSPAAIQLALTATLLLAGCTNHDTKYRVAEDDETVPILAIDLGVADETASKMGATLLETKPSIGRFPAGLCVIRVNALLDEKTDQRRLRVFPLPKSHAVYWNHLFDDLPSIREVVFLGKPGLDPRGYGWHELLYAAAQRECGLCIIYARVEATIADAEYVGVLWDTRSLEPLATCRAPAVLPP